MNCKYKGIVADLFWSGKPSFSEFSKQEFMIACMENYNVCKRTAERVYKEYHKLVNAVKPHAIKA